MHRFLILRLQGPMQGWSGHSYEGRRPLVEYPTRSGILGLLAACLGICRTDLQGQSDLSASVRYAVRRDARRFDARALTDYHTVRGARESYQGLKSHDTIQTWRDYLCDAVFTVALRQTDDARYTLDDIAHAVRAPRYTPFLGRRSCPITRPLFDCFVEAADAVAALNEVAHIPVRTRDGDRDGGSMQSAVTYAEEPAGNYTYADNVRDEPLSLRPRQFASRRVYVYEQGVPDVSE